MHRLLTIPISHYCEKARWALERASIPYRHEAYVQGLHWFASVPRGRSRSVPVLLTSDGRVLSESRGIVEFADQHLTGPRRLFNGDPEVSRLADRFDARVGPHARRWMYYHVLDRPGLIWSYGREDVPGWHATILPLALPMIRGLIERGLDVNATTAARSLDIVRREMDDVAALLADGRPYLTGERFTAADLGFACMMAPMTLPRGYGVRLPHPAEMPAAARVVTEEVAAHPAGRFAVELFERERR